MARGKGRVRATAGGARDGLRPSRHGSRAELALRLQERRPEIEEAILARSRSIADPSAVADPEYAQHLKGAVHVALEHALTVLEGATKPSDPLPAELVAQARLAARNAVPLDAVLLRYLAGHSLLSDFVLQEGGASLAELRLALRAQTRLLERVVAAVTDAYRREVEQRHRGADHRRTEQVKRLLAGKPHDIAELRYELELWHLGVVASGTGAVRALRELATGLDRVLLTARPGGQEIWAWLGGHRRLEAKEVLERARAHSPPELMIAIGEPRRGVSGWRVTHRQARAALPVAMRGAHRIVRYSEVALLASVLGDEVLTSTLLELYLAPLAAERDGGAVLRETLRAYFAAARSVSSAAAALGVSRQTVNSRLHVVEERIGRQLDTCTTELQTALRLWDLLQCPSVPDIRQAD